MSGVHGSVEESDFANAHKTWDRLRRPIWVFDPQSLRGLYANAPALELWAAPDLEELLGRDFSQLSPAVLARLKRLADGTADGEAITERWTFYPNGSPVTVEAVISTLVLDRGRAVLLFEAAPADVGIQERRAVEALRHTSSLISLFNSDGQSIFTNPPAFLAYNQADFISRFSSPGEGKTMLGEVLGGALISELLNVRTAEGGRWHHLDARRVTDPVSGQVSVLLSERDMTAQVEAEQALTVARERAEVAEAKERFLATMSHELRTPLNSVLGFAALLSRDDLSEAQAGHVARIMRSGETLLGIINDLIAVSELDAQRVILDVAPFDAAQMVRDAVRKAERDAAAKGLELEVAYEATPSGFVLGDAARLADVIARYLSNAVKFTDRGRIVVALDAKSEGEEAVALEVSVRDTGAGLSAELQERLFQPFTLGDDSRQRQFGGGGLGLAISRQIIALMGGEVGVESAPGAGARFWFRVTLPAVGAAAGLTEEVEDGGSGRPLNVLCADDHEANRTLIKAMLESQGHACDTVEDGAQAVLAVRTGCYDLVLMDIQMPVQDGVAAALDIRAMPGTAGQVPILAVTANTLSLQREAYAAAGMNDCIAKPVDTAELLGKIEHWAAFGGRDRRPVAVGESF